MEQEVCLGLSGRQLQSVLWLFSQMIISLMVFKAGFGNGVVAVAESSLGSRMHTMG